MHCLICKESFEEEELFMDLCGECADNLESMDLEDQFELLMEI